MSGLENRHIAIVGAGVGGLAAGLLCARAGARVTLFERTAEPRTVGSGILLQPNGLAVLYGLDLDERLPRRGARVSALRIADACGRTLLDVPVPRFAEGLDHALVLRRSELLSALADLVVAEPRIACRFGTDVVGVSADGSVTHRTAGGTASITADLVVGADGVHSRVRKQSGIRARVGRSFWYARGIGAPVDTDATMTEYWTALGIFGVAPLDQGTYFYAATDAKPVASALRERDLDLFRTVWTRTLPVAGEVLAGVQRLEDLVVNQVIRVDCTRWTRGRIVLLGDAAHAMDPNLGQGANSALVDATVLAWELAQPGDQEAALLRYEQRRRSAVHIVQNVAGQLAWLSHLTHPAIRWLRDRTTRHVARVLAGNVSMRLVEQSDPLSLRLAATSPTGSEPS